MSRIDVRRDFLCEEKKVTPKRALGQQPEQEPEVIVCHCDTNTHTIIHGAAVKEHFRSGSEGTL